MGKKPRVWGEPRRSDPLRIVNHEITFGTFVVVVAFPWLVPGDRDHSQRPHPQSSSAAGVGGLVGIVAGVGAIVFYVATRAVEHYAFGVVAGYYPEPRPGGEPPMTWLPQAEHPLRFWLLLVIPTVGGLLSGILGIHLGPRGGRTRHRLRHRRLS